MITIRGLISAAALVSVGMMLNEVITYSTTPTITEQILVPYKQAFMDMVKHTGMHLDLNTIKFESLPNNTIGICNPLMLEIKIDPVYWSTADEKERIAVTFHEFNHCICLDLVHAEGEFED
jgi:hypothetical protein